MSLSSVGVVNMTALRRDRSRRRRAGSRAWPDAAARFNKAELKLRVEVVVDGAHAAVRGGADAEGAAAGGLQPMAGVALTETQDAQAGPEGCWMWTCRGRMIRPAPPPTARSVDKGTSTVTVFEQAHGYSPFCAGAPKDAGSSP